MVIVRFFKWLFSEAGSHVIYNLGVGLGAFIGGLAGLKVVKDWLKEKRRQRRIREYARRYPKDLEDNNEEGWELSHDPDRRGALYVLDHRDQTRHWIANWRTFQDLFNKVPQPDDPRKGKLFKEYRASDNVLTVGNPEP